MSSAVASIATATPPERTHFISRDNVIKFAARRLPELKRNGKTFADVFMDRQRVKDSLTKVNGADAVVVEVLPIMPMHELLSGLDEQQLLLLSQKDSVVDLKLILDTWKRTHQSDELHVASERQLRALADENLYHVQQHTRDKWSLPQNPYMSKTLIDGNVAQARFYKNSAKDSSATLVKQVADTVVVEKVSSSRRVSESSSDSSSSSSSDSSSDDEARGRRNKRPPVIQTERTNSPLVELEQDVSSSSDEEEDSDIANTVVFEAIDPTAALDAIQEALDSVIVDGAIVNKQLVAEAMFDSETIKESVADLVLYTAEERSNGVPSGEYVLFEAVPDGRRTLRSAKLDRVALRTYHEHDDAFAGMHIDSLFENYIIPHRPTALDPSELSIVCRPMFGTRNLGRLATLLTAPRRLSEREFMQVTDWIRKLKQVNPSIRFDVYSHRAVQFFQNYQATRPNVVGDALVLHGRSEDLQEFQAALRQYAEALLLDWLFGLGRANSTTPIWGNILLIFAFLHAIAVHGQRSRRAQEWLATSVYADGTLYERGKYSYDEFKQDLGQAYDSVSSSVKSAWKNVSEYAGQQYDAAKAYLSNPEFKAKLSSYAQQVAESLSRTYESIKNNAGEAYDKLSATLGPAYEQFKAKSREAYEKVGEALKNIPQWTSEAKAYLVAKAQEAREALAKLPESERWQALKRKLVELQDKASQAGVDLKAYLRAKYEDWKTQYDEWSNRPNESSSQSVLSSSSKYVPPDEQYQLDMDKQRILRERRERDAREGIPASLDEADRMPQPLPPRDPIETIALDTALGKVPSEERVVEAHRFIDAMEKMPSPPEPKKAVPDWNDNPRIPVVADRQRLAQLAKENKEYNDLLNSDNRRLREQQQQQQQQQQRQQMQQQPDTIVQNNRVEIPPLPNARYNRSNWTKREEPVADDKQTQIINDMRKENQDVLAWMSGAQRSLYNPSVVSNKLSSLTVLQNGLPHPESFAPVTDHIALLRNVPDTPQALAARTAFISEQLDLCHRILERAAFDPYISEDGGVDYNAALQTLERKGEIQYEQTLHLMEFLDFVVSNHLDVAARRGTDYYDQVRSTGQAVHEIWRIDEDPSDGYEMRSLGGACMRLISVASSPASIDSLLIDPKRRILRAGRAVSTRFAVACYNRALLTTLDECMLYVDNTIQSGLADANSALNSFVRSRINSFSAQERELGQDVLLLTQYLHTLGAVLLLPQSVTRKHPNRTELLQVWRRSQLAHQVVWGQLKLVLDAVVDAQRTRAAFSPEDEIDVCLLQEYLTRALGDTEFVRPLLEYFRIEQHDLGFFLHQFLMDLDPLALEWNDDVLVNLHHSLIKHSMKFYKVKPSRDSPELAFDHNVNVIDRTLRILPAVMRYDTTEMLHLRQQLLFDIGVARLICSLHPDRFDIWMKTSVANLFGSDVRSTKFLSHDGNDFEMPDEDIAPSEGNSKPDELSDVASQSLMDQTVWHPSERKAARFASVPIHHRPDFILPSIEPLNRFAVHSPSFTQVQAVLRDVRRCYSWNQVAHLYRYHGISMELC